jgi:hypothetical protein
MGDYGPSYKPQKLGFSSQALGPLKHLEVQRVIMKKINVVPRVGDIWIPIDTSIKNCCAQFYILELDNRTKARDRILRIAYSGKVFHMFCWLYYTDLYGCLFWRYIGRRDMDYKIRVGSNRLQYVESEERGDEVELKD